MNSFPVLAEDVEAKGADAAHTPTTTSTTAAVAAVAPVKKTGATIESSATVGNKASNGNGAHKTPVLLLGRSHY